MHNIHSHSNLARLLNLHDANYISHHCNLLTCCCYISPSHLFHFSNPSQAISLQTPLIERCTLGLHSAVLDQDLFQKFSSMLQSTSLLFTSDAILSVRAEIIEKSMQLYKGKVA